MWPADAFARRTDHAYIGKNGGGHVIMRHSVGSDTVLSNQMGGNYVNAGGPRPEGSRGISIEITSPSIIYYKSMRIIRCLCNKL